LSRVSLALYRDGFPKALTAEVAEGERRLRLRQPPVQDHAGSFCAIGAIREIGVMFLTRLSFGKRGR